MTLQAKWDRFNTGTGTGTIQRTGYGFQPKIAFLFASGSLSTGTDEAAGGDSRMAFGVAISASKRYTIAIFAQDAQGTSVEYSAKYNDCAIALIGTALDGKLDLQTFDSGGVTWIIDDAFTQDYEIQTLCLGGDGNWDAGTISIPGATGLQQTTSLSWRPTGLMLFDAPLGAAMGLNSQLYLSQGWATASGAGNQGCIAFNHRHGRNTIENRSYGFDNECYARCDFPFDTVIDRAQLSQFLDNGFELNWLERISTSTFIWVACNGIQCKVANVLTLTNTTTDITATLNFEARAGLLASVCRPKSTQDTPTVHGASSLGGFAGTGSGNQGACGHVEEDATADSEVTRATRHADCYVNLDLSDALEGAMYVNTITSTAVNFRMSDADEAQNWVTGLFFGDAPAVTIPPKEYYYERRRN